MSRKLLLPLVFLSFVLVAADTNDELIKEREEIRTEIDKLNERLIEINSELSNSSERFKELSDYFDEGGAQLINFTDTPVVHEFENIKYNVDFSAVLLDTVTEDTFDFYDQLEVGDEVVIVYLELYLHNQSTDTLQAHFNMDSDIVLNNEEQIKVHFFSSPNNSNTFRPMSRSGLQLIYVSNYLNPDISGYTLYVPALKDSNYIEIIPEQSIEISFE